MKKRNKQRINAAGILTAALLLISMTSLAVTAEKESALFQPEVTDTVSATPSTAEKEPAEKTAVHPATPSVAKKEGPSVTTEDLAGTWTVDGTTSYRFEKNGQGALLLPEHSYPFRYQAESDRLELHFEKEEIGTACFTAEITEDMLILVRKEAAGEAEFLLERLADD